jgi:hypothetical protein
MRTVVRSAAVPLLAFALVVVGSAGTGHPISEARGCRPFPRNNHWNLPVDDLPVHPNSDALVRSIGLDEGLHPDFGSGKYQGARIGIPYVGVGRGQRKVRVTFQYDDESDAGPYPIPRDVPIEGGRNSDGDRHVIVVQRGTCKLYELFDAHPVDGGDRWRAGSGAIWDMDTNKLRPKGWTSADAAGLPIFPGLVRWHDVKHGAIRHAIRFTVSRTRREYIYPARHFAADSNDNDLPAMGQRLRLKRSFDISGFPKQVRVILKALKVYGMIVADNGSDWYLTGAPHRRWNNDALHRIGEVEGRHFEVVDTSRLPRP